MTTPTDPTAAALQPPSQAGAMQRFQVVQLPPMDSDDLLPGPGRWTSTLSRQLLLLMSMTAVALVIWPMQETVQAAGSIRPDGENTLIQSEAGGRVAQVFLTMNQQVRRGQTLAVFDTRMLLSEERQLQEEIRALERQARQARSEEVSLSAQIGALESLARSLTATSRTTVDQARASLAFERRQLSRYTSLLDAGAVPQALVEERRMRQMISQSELLKALQGVSEQRSRSASELARLRQSASQSRASADEWNKQMAQRRARLEQVRRQLDLATVRAPIQGSILQTGLRHGGQVVQPGETIAVLAPAGGRQSVRLLVAPDAISQVRPGQRATLKVSACPTAEFGVLEAKVVSVGADTQSVPAARGESSAASGYAVELRPQADRLSGRQGDCRLKPGMQLQGDIVTRRTTVMVFLLNKLRLLDHGS
ncbi:MAG: hypothetical protein RLZZ611_454 [Cyanobacteriota bacterium]